MLGWICEYTSPHAETECDVLRAETLPSEAVGHFHRHTNMTSCLLLNIQTLHMCVGVYGQTQLEESIGRMVIRNTVHMLAMHKMLL